MKFNVFLCEKKKKKKKRERESERAENEVRAEYGACRCSCEERRVMGV